MLIYGGAFPFLSIPRRSQFSIHRLNYIRQQISPQALPVLITKMPRKLTFLMMVLFLLSSGAKSRSISATTWPESTPPETSSHIPAGSSPVSLYFQSPTRKTKLFITMQDCELMSLFLFKQEESSINDDGSCSGLESAEECLIRRSMADHTDYIYTQDISGP